MVHFNKLTPAEAERLAIVAEECGELVQVIGKILRHGYGDGNQWENRENLMREAGDVCGAIRRLFLAGDIDVTALQQRITDKDASIVKWLHHQ